MKKVNRVGIDCRLFGSKHAGIGRYIENLVFYLLLFKTNYFWILFFHDKEQISEFKQKIAKFFNNDFKVGDLDKNIKIVLAPIKHYSLKEQFALPKIFQKENLDLLHVPHFNAPIFYSGKLILTIHDLLWHEMRGSRVTTLPMWKYYLKYWFYLFVVKINLKKALKIVVPAETTKKTILRIYPKIKGKIVVALEGVFFKKTKQNNQVQLDLPKKYLLYVGSLYPHKNVDLILDNLKKIDYNLVVVSTRSVFLEKFRQKIIELNLENKVLILERLKDDDLIFCYQNARALVQPSLSEGFGLTPLEAMFYQTLVLVSDIPIFREVCGEIPFYFNPKSSKSFLDALDKMEKINRSNRLELGKNWVGKYSFRDMVLEIYQLYQNVLYEKKS
jgi:glycosyltransferase involved in cell wall biosynthesis